MSRVIFTSGDEAETVLDDAENKVTTHLLLQIFIIKFEFNNDVVFP